jgi:hypothetical protein
MRRHPADLDVLRVDVGMLGIPVTAGIDPQTAAWTIDALFHYVGADAMDIAVAEQNPSRRSAGS